jgi:hypothetical protein
MPTLTERLNRLLFQRAVKCILDTPATARGGAPFAALSMVHQRDVLPYLLAIKTFALFARPERILLVADPSLDAGARQLLRRHVPHVEILEAVDFRRPALPVGGTWERLAAISALCAESSIVQLDADTVTFDKPTEVVDAACEGLSFVIRSEAGVEIVALDAAAEQGRRLTASSTHIQAVAEARLTVLPNWEQLRYVRGCSGFTGFGRNAISPQLLDWASQQMRAIHGARWDEWGTEQVTSNLLASSAPNAFMLPHPRYCNADSKNASTVVAHYIGYARHVNRDYERMARQSVEALHKR